MTSQKGEPVDPTARSNAVRDVVLLIARIGLGVMMVAHAKVMLDFLGSVSGVIQGLGAQGIPLAPITGPAILLLEFVGGAAMIVGLAVPVVGVLFAVNMVGAWLLVHNIGLYSIEGRGPETVIALGLLSLVLAVTGSGRFGLDYVLFRPRREKAGKPQTAEASTVPS